MITLIGSSNMYGGHQNGGGSNESNLLKTLLSNSLSTTVTSFACPGKGIELYLDNMIYAKKKYNTKLFVVEIFHDRSFHTMLIPNQYMIEQSQSKNIDSMYTETLDNIYTNCRVNVLKYSEHESEKFKSSTIGSHIPFKKIVKYKNTLQAIEANMHFILNLQLKKMINSVQSFCDLTNSHVIWQFHHTRFFEEWKDFLFDYVPKDRLVNSAIEYKGVQTWGIERGYLCDDNEHLTYEGDRAYVKEILAPFIKDYCKKNSIIF